MTTKKEIDLIVKAQVRQALEEMRKVEKATRDAGKAAKEAAREREKAWQAEQTQLAKTNAAFDSMRAARISQFKGIAVGIGAASAALGVAAVKAREFAQESVQVQAVFQTLSIDIGGAREATLGLVNDLDLATAANNAVRLGVVESGDAFAELAGIATKLGLSVGQDATKSVEDLTTALARQSPMILDNLGIQVDLKKANEAYAKVLKKSVSELTDAERKTAFMNAAMVEGRAAAEGVAIDTESAAIAMERMAIEAENLKLGLQGASDAQGAAAEAIRSLGEEVRTLDIETYGADLDKVEAALRRYGTTIEDVGGKQKVLNLLTKQAANLRNAEAIEKARKAEEKRAKAMEAALAPLKEETAERAHMIDLLQAQGADQETITALQIEQLNVEAEQLRISGMRTEELAKQLETLQRQKEVLEAKSAAPRRRGGGRRRETIDDLISRPLEDSADSDAAAAFDEILRDQQAAEDKRIQSLIEFEEITGQRMTDAEKARLDQMHDARMADFERRQALAAKERAAQEKHAAFMVNSTMKIAGATERGFAQAAFAAAGAEEERGRIFGEEVKAFAGARAQELSIQALLHFTKAAAFGAAGLAPKAVMEATAGGIAAAGAAGLAATYGIASSAMKGGAGSQHAAEGPGNAFNLRPGGGSGGFDDPEAPISPLEEGLSRSSPRAAGRGAGSGATVIVQGSVFDSDETGMRIQRMIQDSERGNGRFLA